MAVKVYMSDGAEFTLKASLAEFSKAVQLASDANTVIRVENGNGKVRVLNPEQITFWEETEDEALDPSYDRAPAAAGD